MGEGQVKLIEALENSFLADLMRFFDRLLNMQTLLFFMFHYEYVLLAIAVIFLLIMFFEMKYRGKMKIYDYFLEAKESILENKLRSFFSVFGLSIGIASMIGILGIGQSSGGLTYYERDSIKRNEEMSYVFALTPEAKQAEVHFRDVMKLTLRDVADLKRDCPGIMTIVPYINTSAVKISNNNKVIEAVLTGTTSDHKFFRPLLTGRFFSAEEVKKREKVCLITGDSVKDELFGNIDPVGKYIKIKDELFLVTGVINPLELENRVILPASLSALSEDFEGFSSFLVETLPGTNIEKFKRNLVECLSKNHNKKSFKLRQLKSFTLGKSWEEEKQEEISLTPIQAIMGVIAFVSILIGGIGIMNVMLISVTQRTREIGGKACRRSQKVRYTFSVFAGVCIFKLYRRSSGVNNGHSQHNCNSPYFK